MSVNIMNAASTCAWSLQLAGEKGQSQLERCWIRS